MRNITWLAVIIATAIAVPVHAQTPDASTSANPELVGALASELGSTPKQAEGAAGALFGLAKTKLAPADWSKVAGAVPGMDGLLKAAPAMGSGMPSMGSVAGLAGLAGSFQKLGLSPDMVMKAAPVLTKYVSKAGGADVGQLLAGALK